MQHRDDAFFQRVDPQHDFQRMQDVRATALVDLAFVRGRGDGK
jgi:hypothetical protein